MNTAIIVLKSSREYHNKFVAAFSSYRRCVSYMKRSIDDITDRSVVTVSNNNGTLCLIANNKEFQFDFIKINLSDPDDFRFIGTIADEIVGKL